ncbi:unnamed protein product [Rotaria sp. Silwood2]|nr:unnamed protein product [Rotaria sp. Silwood2]CAF3085117.1 unnamed protein product [Rotaria sp. Silwood2]
MKLPKESYIPSRILSSDSPIITMNVIPDMNQISIDGTRVNSHRTIQLDNNSDDHVLAAFLRLIGCRTIHVQSFIAHQNTLSKTPKSIKENCLIFIRYLIDSFQTMSEEDIAALKQTQCFAGIYHFLSSLGVREAPNLDDLIDMITEDFKNQQFEQGASLYIIPPSLEFLAQNVEKYYPELWKDKTNRRAFLPAQWPDKPTGRRDKRNSNRIVLMPVEKIFKSLNLFLNIRLHL